MNVNSLAWKLWLPINLTYFAKLKICAIYVFTLLIHYSNSGYSLKFYYFPVTFFPNCNSLGPLLMYPVLKQSFFHMFPNRDHCFPIGLSNFLKFPIGNHRLPEKSLIENKLNQLKDTDGIFMIRYFKP